MPSAIQEDLIGAIRAGDTPAVSALLEAGADANAVTVQQSIYDHQDGRIPLTIAAELGNAAMIRCLLEHGADISLTNVHQHSFGCTALMYAARSGNYASVRLLLSQGADVNAESRHGQTALMWAAYHGRNLVTRCLLRAGADVNARAETVFPRGITTPLIEAVRGGRDMTVSLLLRSGAKNTGEEGWAALMMSQSKGYRAIERTLKSAQHSGSV